MTVEEIDKIIAQGEGVSIEFKKAKEKVPASLYETVVSFANTRVGRKRRRCVIKRFFSATFDNV